MAWFIGQSAVMIVLAFLLGLLIGWIIWHRRSVVDASAAPKAETARKAEKNGAAKAPVPAEAVAVVPTPVHDEPEPEPIDDLARIEGIGPKVAGALVEAGIRTYDRMADSDVDTLRAAINGAGIKFAPSITTWSRQAALLATGDETGFQTLVDHLTAGREPGAPGAEPSDAADTAAPEAPVAELAPVEDLARIEGIGPKIAAALVDAGIRTYGQLADTGPDELRAAINAAGIKFAPSIISWSQQAKLLADGDEAAFQTLTERLIAGRDVQVAEERA